MSYVSSLGLGLVISKLITSNNISYYNRIFYFLSIFFLIAPFFLGASRGSLIALSLPILLFLVFNKTGKQKTYLLILISILAIIFYFASDVFGSLVFNRFTRINEDISTGNSSTFRLYLWEKSYEQFLHSPITGSSLEVNNFNIYPHNIFIEVGISTGIIGLSVFSIWTISCIKSAIFLLKNKPHFFWVVTIFIQSFAQAIFSGALYSSLWFFASAGLLMNIAYRKTI